MTPEQETQLLADVAWIRAVLERLIGAIEGASSNPMLARLFGLGKG